MLTHGEKTLTRGLKLANRQKTQITRVLLKIHQLHVDYEPPDLTPTPKACAV